MAVSSVCGLFARGAFAHPASGIVVNAKGEVFFIHTGQGACKIEAHGKLTYTHKDSGGHWMALDTEGKFSSAADTQLFKRLTPSGVKPALLYASGGAPLVVNQDGNLYYGSGFPDGDDMAPGGLTPAQAQVEIARLKGLFTVLDDTPAVFPEWEQLVVAYQVSGKNAHDARLVAAMNVHGIGRLLTFNKPDFHRYHGITVLSPEDVLKPSA